MNRCKSCDNGLTEVEELTDQCFDCMVKERYITLEDVLKIKIEFYKGKLHEVLKCCDLNGAGMRELIGEFSDEVLGS